MKIEKTLRLSYLHLDSYSVDFLWNQAGYDGYDDSDYRNICLAGGHLPQLASFDNYMFDRSIISTKYFRNPENFTDEIPTDLRRCIEFALANDCDWICFSPEEPVISELPIFPKNCHYGEFGGYREVKKYKEYFEI